MSIDLAKRGLIAAAFFTAAGAAPAALADGVSASHGVTLIHGTQTARAKEKGVSIYRGATPQRAPELAGGEDIEVMPAAAIIVQRYRYPPRRLRSQGFWSGTGPMSKRFNHGFFAERTKARGGRAAR